jgi:DNA phosphorothioation-dependent restriction protein DptH
MHRRILILDYSGSYNEFEIAKAGLNIPYVSWNPYRTPFFWRVCVDSEPEFISKLADILLTVMNITSYIQRKVLLEALEIQMKQQHLFNFKDFYQTLEKLYSCKEESDKSADELTNLERLLTRFFPYRELDSIHIKPGKITDKPCTSRLCILQLSEYSEQQRKFLTLIFSELLWVESKNRKSPHRFDTILFDEFQFLPIKTGSALALFLREGRKLGVGLILSTQYISSYSQDEIEVLLQAGNLLVFHPNDRDLKFSAKILDHEHPNLWIPLLKKLDIGQALLKGNYFVNGHSQILHDPVVCNITAEDGGDQNG